MGSDGDGGRGVGGQFSDLRVKGSGKKREGVLSSSFWKRGYMP